MNEWIESGLPWRNWNGDSFCGRGLNNPGTIVEVDGKMHLIGTINELGGVCDDCVGFDGDSIVTRYKVAYKWHEAEGASTHETALQ